MLRYEVMSSCWTVDVETRPKTSEIHQKLTEAFQNVVKSNISTLEI